MGNADPDVFTKALETATYGMGIDIPSEVLDMFCEYRKLLLKANEVMNLTAIIDDEGMAVKHFGDSLTCLLAPGGKRYDSLVDIGTGAGFPGLVLHMVNPSSRALLIDSVGKKVQFIKDVCTELGLHNVEAVHARAEDLARSVQYRERFDLAVARGVSALAPLSEYCLPFVRTGGWFIAMKGPRVEEELEQGARASALLGGGNPEILAVNLPGDLGERRLVSIRKERATPSRYPRKPGSARRDPLGSHPG